MEYIQFKRSTTADIQHANHSVPSGLLHKRWEDQRAWYIGQFTTWYDGSSKGLKWMETTSNSQPISYTRNKERNIYSYNKTDIGIDLFFHTVTHLSVTIYWKREKKCRAGRDSVLRIDSWFDFALKSGGRWTCRSRFKQNELLDKSWILQRGVCHFHWKVQFWHYD